MKLYQYIPAWNVPCISPYVSKVVYYMKMTGIDCEIVRQDLGTLAEDAPRGKLPYLVLDDGAVVCDSNEIIAYCKQTFGDPLDEHLSAGQKAECVAWTRLCDEHLYWSGVIQPRWREDAGWETYIPFIVGGAEVGTELRGALDAFRTHIVEEFTLQGMGRAQRCGSAGDLQDRHRRAVHLPRRQALVPRRSAHRLGCHDLLFRAALHGRAVRLAGARLRPHEGQLRRLLRALQEHLRNLTGQPPKGGSMTLLNRDDWYDISRDVDWTPSYVDASEAFPEGWQGLGSVPKEAFAEWDEPFRVSYRDYVRTQREKDTGVYAVKDAFRRANVFDLLDDGYKAAAHLHMGSTCAVEQTAVTMQSRFARFAPSPRWRSLGVYGMLDEIRHAQLDLAFAHDLVKQDPRFDWTQKAFHTNEWASSRCATSSTASCRAPIAWTRPSRRTSPWSTASPTCSSSPSQRMRWKPAT